MKENKSLLIRVHCRTRPSNVSLQFISVMIVNRFRRFSITWVRLRRLGQIPSEVCIDYVRLRPKRHNHVRLRHNGLGMNHLLFPNTFPPDQHHLICEYLFATQSIMFQTSSNQLQHHPHHTQNLHYGCSATACLA